MGADPFVLELVYHWEKSGSDPFLFTAVTAVSVRLTVRQFSHRLIHCDAMTRPEQEELEGRRPGRRESGNWVYDTVPLIPAKPTSAILSSAQV